MECKLIIGLMSFYMTIDLCIKERFTNDRTVYIFIMILFGPILCNSSVMNIINYWYVFIIEKLSKPHWTPYDAGTNNRELKL